MLAPSGCIPAGTAAAVVAVVPLLPAGDGPGQARAEPASAVCAPEASVSRAAPSSPAGPLDPVRIAMSASPRARGATGTMVLRLDASPFGVAVEPDGSYRYHLVVEVEGLRGREDSHHVVWAATPELDEHRRIGVLPRADGSVEGTIAWNKFLVFVTAEDTPDPASWSQRILLSALSPSGRMHTMAGHGPFSGEPCLDPRQ